MVKDIYHLFTVFIKERRVFGIFGGIALISITIGSVVLDLIFNNWRNVFWSAVEAKNTHLIWHQVGTFCILATISILLYTSISYGSQRYFLEWRKALYHNLLNRWLVCTQSNSVPVNTIENVDQRLQEDTGRMLDLFNQLFLGLVSAVFTILLFLPLLYSLGGSLLPIGHITGHYWLPTVCLVASFLGLSLTRFLGRNLVTLQNSQQATEADLRYELVQIRNGSEMRPITLKDLWHHLYVNHVSLFTESMHFTLGSNLFFQSLYILPIFCVLPSFLSGLVMMGSIMAVLDAFSKISTSFNWYLENYLSITAFKATLTRLVILDKSL